MIDVSIYSKTMPWEFGSIDFPVSGRMKLGGYWGGRVFVAIAKNH
jgi:hypothetical protein